jgi:Domain of unknown function (DUF4331)
MSHHFDTPTAKDDPRINVCDFYLFRGRPGTTVMAMTVNPNAGVSAPDTFRDEGLYAFRFDLNRDAREEVAFKFQFGAVTHADGEEQKHVQNFQVRRATGNAALRGTEGELIGTGHTGQVVKINAGAVAFAGLAPDLFAGDAVALHAFQNGICKENRLDPDAFQNRKNFFAKQNVSAIVLEVPSHLIGQGLVHSWATASLYGHAPEVQVSRWGLPLITHLFLSDPALKDIKEEYNRAMPADDVERFCPQICKFAEKMTGLAGSVTSPADYAKQLMARICPTTLPYELDTAAAFNYAGFNGRGLADDVMDVMLTLATNTALGDGVAPDKGRTRSDFPYFGEPYTSAEQAVAPVQGLAKK